MVDLEELELAQCLQSSFLMMGMPLGKQQCLESGYKPCKTAWSS